MRKDLARSDILNVTLMLNEVSAAGFTRWPTLRCLNTEEVVCISMRDTESTVQVRTHMGNKSYVQTEGGCWLKL